ncbi:MAG: replicative DNA helicase [Succinivibrionaceae bacterium]|nr:replicative DNA helicase [Succinivibrionaceae bacterium]MEE1340633.1 replicative DNA helicase [Succinivibrionaceae bacterium]
MAKDVALSRWSEGNNNNTNNNNSNDQVEVFSIESEQAVLGGIFIDTENLKRAVDLFGDQNPFYQKKHQWIFDAMVRIASDKGPHEINSQTVEMYLEKLGVLNECGGISYLLYLQDKAPKTSDITIFAQNILDKAKSRLLLSTCEEITNLIYNPSKYSTQDIIDIAEKKIFAINQQTQSTTNGPVALSIPLKELFDKLREGVSESGITGTSTGYKSLDDKTSGFHEGQLIIIAARPAMGKTTFAMNLVENIVMKTPDVKPALVFSLEMRSIEIAQRVLSSLSRVHQNKIRNHNLDADDWKKIAGVMGRFISEDKSKAIFIDDQSSLTPLDIRTRARRLAKEYGGLSVIMVDYLQLMRAPGFGDNRALEVAECSRSLKALSKELNVPVLALAQLNRGLENRKEKRPMPSDLRESGSIEQDADIILFVHREEVYNPNNPDLVGKAEIIIGKNRSGETGTINMAFLKEFSRFEQLETNRTPDNQ